MLDTLKQDLLYAGRSLLRTPLFTVTTAIVLTLGIGANAAIFSVVDAVLLRPLPYPDAERIVHMRGTANWVAWERGHGFRMVPNGFSESPLFEAVGVYALGGVKVGGDAAERTQAVAVTPGFLEALGVSPALGRRFSQTRRTTRRRRTAWPTSRACASATTCARSISSSPRSSA